MQTNHFESDSEERSEGVRLEGRATSMRLSIHCHPVEALRVVAEDLLLQLNRDVVAVGEMGDRIGEFAVPMRVVGGEQDVLFREEIGDVAQGLLFRLAPGRTPCIPTASS